MNTQPEGKKEDITEILVVAETIVSHTKLIEAKLAARIQKLEVYIEKLEKEVTELKNTIRTSSVIV